MKRLIIKPNQMRMLLDKVGVPKRKSLTMDGRTAKIIYPIKK